EARREVQAVQRRHKEDLQGLKQEMNLLLEQREALQKQVSETAEEAVTLRQEVASLKRKLEDLEKERKDVLHEQELYQQQMRDVEKENEMPGPEIRNHKENNEELEGEREGVQEDLEHGAAVLKKSRDNTQVLTALLNNSELSKGSLKKGLDILNGKMQAVTGIVFQSTPVSLNYSSAVSHEGGGPLSLSDSQEQESSSWSLEQLSQESSHQGHEAAQVWREEELLGQKADLEGQLAAAEWLRQDLARQLAETRSAKESLQSRLFAAQQQMAQLQMTSKRVEAELQAELQEARREVQAVQRRHKEDLQGLKQEMNLLLEQREALQKQVGELTSQLAASRECQEPTVQRAQQDGREAQEESRQKLVEIEHIQKLLEEARNQKKKLQVHLQYLDREWRQWEEVAKPNSELQASVNALEREKDRLIQSLEEKNQCLRTLREENLTLKNHVSQLFSVLKKAELLRSQQRREMQEVNDQVQATLLAEIEKRDHQACQEKQLLETELSELRLRLQCSEKRAEAMAAQCKAVVLELKKTQAQRDNLRAHNQELRKQMEEDAQEWFTAEARHISHQIALEKEATERQEEAVTLRQEVASLKRKLEDLEKERKDVLQQMRDVEKENEMRAPEMRNHRENNEELEGEREGVQEDLEHGTAALKKSRDNTQVLTALLNNTKESLQSRLFAAQQQMAQLQMTSKRVEAELQAELQEAHREVQAVQRRHKEDLQGLKQEMNLLLEQREVLQKQVSETAERAEAIAIQCKAVELELRMRQAQRDNLRAHNQELLKQLEQTSNSCLSVFATCRSAKESLQSRLFAAQQQMAQLQMTSKRVEAELQAELQEARREVQAVQRRHKEDLQGLKQEMNLLLEQREALQKQVSETA
ncbi:unnamed protein product, partial [Coccothraustes coccothraustes]